MNIATPFVVGVDWCWYSDFFLLCHWTWCPDCTGQLQPFPQQLLQVRLGLGWIHPPLFWSAYCLKLFSCRSLGGSFQTCIWKLKFSCICCAQLCSNVYFFLFYFSQPDVYAIFAKLNWTGWAWGQSVSKDKHWPITHGRATVSVSSMLFYLKHTNAYIYIQLDSDKLISFIVMLIWILHNWRCLMKIVTSGILAWP